MKRFLSHVTFTAVTVLMLLGLATVSVETQGPFSAQIVRALKAYGFSTPGNLTGLANGTAAAPSVGFASEATGLYRPSAGVLGFSVQGSASLALGQTTLQLPATSTFGWTATGSPLGALDTTLARGGVGEITISSVAFAALGTPANGTLTYCSDCTVTTAASCPATQASCVCAASGTGAFARRAAGAWYCTF